jgi:hypothetical protein
MMCCLLIFTQKFKYILSRAFFLEIHSLIGEIDSFVDLYIFPGILDTFILTGHIQ